jgi:cobalt/nickel transport system permease protein
LILDFLKIFRETAFTEKHSLSNGLLQKIDSKAKLISFIALILASISFASVYSLIFFLTLNFLLAFASKISFKTFFLRTFFFITFFSTLIAIPTLFMVRGVTLISFNIYSVTLQLTKEGILYALKFILRVWVCISSLTLLTLTTKFSSIINAMESFRIPKVFTMMTSVTYRFLFLFIDEAYRMMLAKENRTVNKMRRIDYMKTLASMMSSLFIRAYERGEKVYLAMKNRGYSMETRSLNTVKFQFKDALFIFFFFVFIGFASLIGGY